MPAKRVNARVPGFIGRHGLWNAEQHRQAEALKRRIVKDKLKLIRLAWADPHGASRAPGGGDPRREVAVTFDDRRRVEDRVFRFRTGYAWSQAPPSRTVRLIGNVEVFKTSKPMMMMVRSNFIISEFWDNATRTLTGWAGHRIAEIDGVWKIAAKQVNLIECDQSLRNPSIIL